uniref:Uncharacterized protein n=1 Tax=Arundo donax TaxID=35708 RepID=A0A0A8ZFB4_ARUDO
MEWRRRRSRIR